MPITEVNASRCMLFRDMTVQERQAVIELLEPAVYPAGEMILREGRAIQILWIIVRGRCEVVKRTGNGGEQQLAVLEPFAVFGEVSFFNPAPHSASVRARTEVEVMRLPREKFEQLEETHPGAAHRLVLNTAKVLGERLRKMDEWICDLIERPEAAKHRQEWREFRQKLYNDWLF